MAGARFLTDVLQMFYEPLTEEEILQSLQIQPDYLVGMDDVFELVQNLYVSEGNANNRDLLAFARETNY